MDFSQIEQNDAQEPKYTIICPLPDEIYKELKLVVFQSQPKLHYILSRQFLTRGENGIWLCDITLTAIYHKGELQYFKTFVKSYINTPMDKEKPFNGNNYTDSQEFVFLKKGDIFELAYVNIQRHTEPPVYIPWKSESREETVEKLKSIYNLAATIQPEKNTATIKITFPFPKKASLMCPDPFFIIPLVIQMENVNNDEGWAFTNKEINC